MLHIIYDDSDENELKYIQNPESFFDGVSMLVDLTEGVGPEAVKKIDHCKVIGPQVVMHEKGFSLSIRDLCGGTKTLLAMQTFPEAIFNASYCGDNCAEFILKMAEEKDITIVLQHHMKFPEPFKVHVVNTDEYCTTKGELALINYWYIYADNLKQYKWNVPFDAKKWKPNLRGMYERKYNL